MTPALRTAVEAALGVPPASWTPAAASSFDTTWRMASAGAVWFVKVATGLGRERLAAEAEGLAALAATGTVRVPSVAACGGVADGAFLALEWVDLRAGGGRDAALGRALAALHRCTGPRFGWASDNAIGATPQPNGWDEDWARFFATRRIAPQLLRAASQSSPAWLGEGERLLARIPALLRGHTPAPSLLHGDLWSGNAACDEQGRPVVFDPAVYYGDREADLAMTELFGGFGADFHAAYREAWPVDPGHDLRRDLYNLYHVLNHFNLFGGAYGSHARRLIGRLLAAGG